MLAGLADELEPSTSDLRPPASLERHPGVWGDMRYVGTVVFGRSQLRRNLRETEMEIEAEKRSRDKELTELARLAVTDESLTTPLIEEARDRLVELEEVRSREAGAAAAAEQAIGSILAERDKVKDTRAKEVIKLEDEITAIEERLAPLEKKRQSIGKRARGLVDQLESFDHKIAAKGRQAGENEDPAEAGAAEAALAGLRAEREVVARAQPELATELSEVDPEIRDLKAEKGELAKAANKLRRAEDESIVRSEEKVVAVRAHKTVVDRAAADRTREQNDLLREVGELLFQQPPQSIARLAKPLEERAAKLESLKADAVDSREKIDSVERWPLVRGLVIWLVIAAAIGAIVYFVAF